MSDLQVTYPAFPQGNLVSMLRVKENTTRDLVEGKLNFKEVFARHFEPLESGEYEKIHQTFTDRLTQQSIEQTNTNFQAASEYYSVETLKPEKRAQIYAHTKEYAKKTASIALKMFFKQDISVSEFPIKMSEIALRHRFSFKAMPGDFEGDNIEEQTPLQPEFWVLVIYF